MNLLFRLDQGSTDFEDIEKARLFFKSTIRDRDDNYFYDSRNLKQIDCGEKIYFSYDSQVVAIAIFTGNTTENKDRDEKFIYGHQLSHIRIIEHSKRMDNKIIGPRSRNYLKTDIMQNEIDRIILGVQDIYPDEITTYTEGASKTVIVNKYERDSEARKECLNHYGYDCIICGFNFELFYGEIGRDAIHVHHIVPLHKIKSGYQVDPINDLIPVCPNCHLILHRKNADDWNKLKSKLNKKHNKKIKSD